MDSPMQTRGQRTSWVLSLVAIAPMVMLALMLVITGRENAGFLPLLDAFKTLSALTLSYLGGIRLGIALRDQSLRPFAMAVTILPAMIGWLSLFLPDALAISLLLLVVCALGAWDSFAFHSGTGPTWFANIRTAMTLLAALAHTIVLLLIL
jgi:hypothetical protein